MYSCQATIEEPLVMWISGLHAPAAYIAAHVQAWAREAHVALDRAVPTTRATRVATPDLLEERPTAVSKRAFISSVFKVTWANYFTLNMMTRIKTNIFITLFIIIIDYFNWFCIPFGCSTAHYISRTDFHFYPCIKTDFRSCRKRSTDIPFAC